MGLLVYSWYNLSCLACTLLSLELFGTAISTFLYILENVIYTCLASYVLVILHLGGMLSINRKGP